MVLLDLFWSKPVVSLNQDLYYFFFSFLFSHGFIYADTFLHPVKNIVNNSLKFQKVTEGLIHSRNKFLPLEEE